MGLHPAALLTAQEARSADSAAIAAGTPGETLMENAGNAVGDLICQEFKPCPVLIVCGGGNNGGDGFVAARLLLERRWPVSVALAGNASDIDGAAGAARRKWDASGGLTRTFFPSLLSGCGLVVDAIFGTGLDRDIEGDAKAAIEAINGSGLPVVAIDIPSGIHSDSGAVMGVAVKARHTVSFARPKPGHVLLPGKAHTGELHVYDIGIKGDNITPAYFLNAPALWRGQFPFPGPEAHKYRRGHALVIGGGIHTTGAARLAAVSALRSGAGLVSVACTPESLPIYAATLTSVMTRPFADSGQLAQWLDDKHTASVLIGPGGGVTESTREQTLQILRSKKPCVIDADAITAFQNNPGPLFESIGGPAVLTPHEGEFSRLFSFTGPRPERARDAARKSNAVIVLKGNDTIIAAPDGRVAINANAPVWLATAGTGDVLAGIITGLLAQGMPAFEAACCGVWMHGEAANHIGPGLIADDLPAALLPVMKSLYS